MKLKKERYLVFLVLSFTLLSVLSSSMTSAQTSSISSFSLNPVEIDLIVNTDGTTYLHMESTVYNIGTESQSSILYRIDSLYASLLYARVNNQEVVGSTSTEDRYTFVSIPFSEGLAVNDTAEVYFIMEVNDFQTNLRLDETGEHYAADFLYYIRPHNEMTNITLSLILPQHSSLYSESVIPIYPNPDYNSTDGYSLLFAWEIASLKAGQEKVVIVKYQFPNLAPVQTFVDTTFLILSGFIGVIIGAVSVLVGPRVYERLKRVGDVRIVGITSEEEEVLEIIRDKGGSCPQKDLYTEMSLSQSKVSIILTNLEERGLIKRFRDGRENMVHILEE